MQRIMQAVFAASLLSLGSCVRLMEGPAVTPVSRAIDLLADMQTKIKAAGVNATKTQAQKAVACKLEAKDIEFSIQTENSEIVASKARIEKALTTITALNTEIEEEAANVAGNEASLANATQIRKNESAVFKEAEADLLDLIDTLQRAISILAQEMGKSDGALLQSSAATSVVEVLESLVQGSTLTTGDASRLSALIQSNKKADVDGEGSALGAPNAAVYESHSDTLIDTMEQLLDQTQVQLAEARKNDQTSQHNFALTAQALELATKEAYARLVDARKDLATAMQTNTTSTDELATSLEMLANSESTLKTLNKSCEEGQKNFEAGAKAREEELGAIATAIDALSGVGAAEEHKYGYSSFLQRSQLSSLSGAGTQVARLLRDLARKQGAPELAQLAARVSSVMGQGGDDPLGKVKGLIKALLEKLIEENNSEEKCGAELAQDEAKLEEQTSGVDELTATINSKTAMSSKLKEEVEEIKGSLTELAEAQAEMGAVRKEERGQYTQAVIDMQEGLQGVALALKALTEYYAKEDTRQPSLKSAASGVIAMLEGVKSDFTLDLARVEETESMSQADYESLTKANGLAKVAKEKDVQYKTKEAAALDQAVADTSTDRADAQEQLDATTEYIEAVRKKCADQVETYEERKARREAEIAGLKEALEILSSEVVLIQQRTSHARGTLRLKPSAD